MFLHRQNNIRLKFLKPEKANKLIIFIPGFASSGEVWNETKVAFEKEYTCYTLTMAGFAGVKPQPNPSFENWEDEIANYIKTNKIEKPILIGHSMGGGLALAIAADYPELIGKIVVVDALPCLSGLEWILLLNQKKTMIVHRS
jgi:pimeloyl-ACP methyl ester carboxylesterase